MISVAIVTASRSLRLGWQTAVDMMPNAHCIGVYATTSALLRMADSLHVDVIILGLTPKDGTTVAIEQLQEFQPGAKILVLASSLSDEQLFSALRAGAAGFLPQNSFPTTIQSAVLQLFRGETPLGKDTAKRIMASFRAQRRSDNLSEREQEVYHLLCEGKNYREIAGSLFVSQNTVRFHLKNIYKKLGVKSRHEAMARAYEAGDR